MLRHRNNPRGVSLIELMIGLAILAMLLAAGLPSLTTYIRNTKIRTGAESIQSGLQIARTEAIKNNANVEFRLTEADGTIAWIVCLSSVCPTALQSRSSAEGGGTARVGISMAADVSGAAAIAPRTGLPAAITFNNFGRVADPAGEAITRADITDPGNNDARWLSIRVTPGGQIRMCVPSLSGLNPPDPRGC